MINFTAWPEMLAWPYLILKGWLPYKDIAIAHNPLMILVLTGFYNIFGIGIIQLKIFTWCLIAINVYLTFYISQRLWNKKIGVISSIIYLLLCLIYQGNGLWFDLALTPFALLLYLFIREKKYLYAGIIFALGFLTKQTFIYFLIPVLVSKINYKNFLLGTMPVFIIFALYLFANNLISSYYSWAIKFGIFYLPHAEGQVLLPNFKQLIFALIPLGVIVFSPELLLWTIVGAMGVYPRWELFHFQPALPFVAIAISLLIYSNKQKIIKILVILFATSYVLLGLNRQLGNTTRFYESDVQKVSSIILKSNYKNIYIINYWDNIYAFTNTLPNKPLIPYIPWYLDYNNNKESMLNSLKTKMPEAIVIGSRDTIFPDLYLFVDQYYSCKIIEKTVELCKKNK